MSLNVEAVRDFGTLLQAIPFNTSSIDDFYCSIRSFYSRLMEWLLKKNGKNQPTIINISHDFKKFLFTLHYLVPLLGGEVKFTALLTSIILGFYHIYLCELKE